MKIILSRKGFDSQYGKQASPIFPDGTLLSFPIPAKDDTVKFSDLMFKNRSYYQIIKELKPNSKIKSTYTCHLDPDLQRNALKRANNWLPLFGQAESAQGHLHKKNVGKGDLFLFFGTFKQIERISDELRYKKDAPEIHLIFGYLQVGHVYTDIEEIKNNFSYHPHAQESFLEKKNNCIYEAKKTLDFDSSLPGAGIFYFHNDLILSKSGYSKSKWQLPVFFQNTEISYHTKDSFKDGYFQSAAKGQEFVVSENDKLTNWAKDIIRKGLKL